MNSLLGDLLNAVYWVDESLQLSLDKAGFDRVPRSWSMIMINLSNGVTRPIKIANNMGVSRQAIHKTLEDMQSRGLVEIKPDPSDGRATVVRVSPKAREIQQAATQSLQEIEHALGQRIGANKLKALKAALREDWGDKVACDTASP